MKKIGSYYLNLCLSLVDRFGEDAITKQVELINIRKDIAFTEFLISLQGKKKLPIVKEIRNFTGMKLIDAKLSTEKYFDFRSGVGNLKEETLKDEA